MHDQWPKGEHWTQWCLEGGEDFELIVSLPPLWAKEWLDLVPNSKYIGIIEAGNPSVLWTNGKPIKRILKDTYKHF